MKMRFNEGTILYRENVAIKSHSEERSRDSHKVDAKDAGIDQLIQELKDRNPEQYKYYQPSIQN